MKLLQGMAFTGIEGINSKEGYVGYASWTCTDIVKELSSATDL